MIISEPRSRCVYRVYYWQFTGRSNFKEQSPGPAWLGRVPSPGPGATTPGGRGRRRAAGPVPRHHPRETGPGSTPCACGYHCCAPAGPGAWAPRLPLPPPACRGERAQGPGRAAPWLFTAQRSAASPTLPVTASFSVSSSRGSHRAPRRRLGMGARPPSLPLSGPPRSPRGSGHFPARGGQRRAMGAARDGGGGLSPQTRSARRRAAGWAAPGSPWARPTALPEPRAERAWECARTPGRVGSR